MPRSKLKAAAFVLLAVLLLWPGRGGNRNGKTCEGLVVCAEGAGGCAPDPAFVAGELPIPGRESR